MIKPLVSLIAFSATVNFVLASVFLLKRYLDDKQNKIILYLFLFIAAKSLSMIDFTAHAFFSRALPHSPYFFISLEPFAFLYAPFFYFYIQACCNKQFTFRRYHLVHFLPALLVVGFIVFNFLFTDVPAFTSRGDFSAFFANAGQTWLFSLRKWLVVGYLALSLVTLRQYFIEVGKDLSEPKQNRQWLVALVTAMLLINVWLIVSPFIQFHFNLGATYKAYSTGGVIVVLFALIATVVFRSMTIHPSEVALPAILPMQKPNKVSSEQLAQVISDLQECMGRHKPYLELGLTLNDLAAKTGWQPRLISEAIKSDTGDNFYRYINRHRIEAAKSLLVDQPERSITEIMYDSGFAGKSTFHDAFKSFVKMTPTQYRETAASLK